MVASTSERAMEIGFPDSRTIVFAISSRKEARISAALRRVSMRSRGFTVRLWKNRYAPWIAFSVSCAFARGTRAMTSPVAGLVTS